MLQIFYNKSRCTILFNCNFISLRIGLNSSCGSCLVKSDNGLRANSFSTFVSAHELRTKKSLRKKVKNIKMSLLVEITSKLNYSKGGDTNGKYTIT